MNRWFYTYCQIRVFFSGPWFIVSIVQGSEGPLGNRCQNRIGTFVAGQDESLGRIRGGGWEQVMKAFRPWCGSHIHEGGKGKN